MWRIATLSVVICVILFLNLLVSFDTCVVDIEINSVLFVITSFAWLVITVIICYFSDTRAERNALMARVYPRLREYCRERGHDFQVVDMRWGVRDEATDDHMTSELCMKELRKCQKFSTGPNFIASDVWMDIRI